MLTPNRDALAKALHDAVKEAVGIDLGQGGSGLAAEHMLATGAVIDVAALVDDEMVVEKIERDIHAMEAAEVDPSVERYAYTALHAMTAVLTDG